MSSARTGPADQRDSAVTSAAAADEEPDSFEEWERYPARVAEENVGYQRLAWYAGAFGDGAFALLALAVIANTLIRVGRAIVRLVLRG